VLPSQAKLGHPEPDCHTQLSAIRLGGEQRHRFCPFGLYTLVACSAGGPPRRAWAQLAAASDRTLQKKNELSRALAGLDSADTSIVAFGSLARNEFTQGSDIDWTLLIDGQAASEHLAIANKVRDEIAKLEGKEPGGEGIFGKLSFSHDIIHQIGGQNDTNANTTQRILLLLESCVLGYQLPGNAKLDGA
jgi:predicted nucleotidyltransferase